MKKFFSLVAIAAMSALCFTSCGSDDDPITETNQKTDTTKTDTTVVVTDKTVDFEATSWNALIDSVQYGGKLIYSADAYTWKDTETTLSSECTKADWGSYGWGWNNGLAISNYIDNDSTASYNKQLSVPVSNGGKNFAIVWDDNSKIAFADSTARVVKSIDVCATTYCLNNIKKNYGKDYFFTVTLTGTKADGTTTTLDIPVAKGTDIISTWKTIDTQALGAVKKIVFTFSGSDKGKYGIATPKYLAIDNIVVKMK